MTNHQDEPQISLFPPLSDPVQTIKDQIAARFRYIRANHPERPHSEKPFTYDEVSSLTGLSKRTLAEVESGRSNLRIESLVNLAAGLGIDRPGYFLDEQVFKAVNAEFAALKQLAEQRVESVAMRSVDPAKIPPELAQLLATIVSAGQEAQASLDPSRSDASERDDRQG
ncbi:helix-turn-helix domain-containing protein [Streptomyces decoyicus]|uniref:helix-turn-helix domain-containing protein n=1 Tax=Streptomyces decoyicus TaxID=249567 RepID=UPI00381C93CC